MRAARAYKAMREHEGHNENGPRDEKVMHRLANRLVQRPEHVIQLNMPPLWLIVPFVAQFILAAILCFVPLFDLLAYEFSFAVGILATLTALIIGLGAARFRPQQFSALWLGWIAALLHLLPPLLLISLNMLRVQNCDYLDGLTFFLLLPVCTSFYATTVGVVLGQTCFAKPRWLRTTIAAVVWLGPLIWSFAHLYTQPQIFVFDHLWGHFAGSLYDENIRINDRLWIFRLGTLLRVGALSSVLHLWQKRALLTLKPAINTALLCLLAILFFEVDIGSKSGFRVSRNDVLKALPVTITGHGIVIHVPAGTTETQQNAILEDHQFRLHQISQKLGVTPRFTIHSYLYTNAAHKGSLMGGEGTMIAKPWQHEIHIHDVVSPHPLLAHELVHVIAAEVANPPFYVSSRYGFLLNMGLVEGLAEAISPERSIFDLDHWTAAMQQLKVAPDIREILGLGGFWVQAPNRAYTSMGSFIRYLLEKHGVEKLRDVYRHGQFAETYGSSVDELVQGWQAHLATLTLAPRELALAQDKFRIPSIFQRVCAHEIANLRDRAAQLPPVQAVSYYEQICVHLRNAPSARYELADAFRRAKKDREFQNLAFALLKENNLSASQTAHLYEELGIIAWEQSELAGAHDYFQKALELEVSVESDRLQWVRLWALQQTEPLRRQLRRYLSNELNPAAAAITAASLIQNMPSDKTAHYLLARQLHRAEEFSGAINELQLAGPHENALIEAERLRLLGDSNYRLSQYSEARVAYQNYAAVTQLSGEKAQAKDWLERLDWLLNAAK